MSERAAGLSPEISLTKIKVPPGFRVELMAAEPLVADPVAFDWDERGRLWVVEMLDYPLGLDGQGEPGGRVRRLEDVDGDGRYDRATVFADKLNFPTGIITWRDGVIITAAPEIIFLRDTNGDGTANERRVLVSGLQEGNQQLRANGLRWGLDNWVYVASGGHRGNYGTGTRVTSALTGKNSEVGSRDFRFRPDTGELEPQSGPTQFGRNRDAYGRWFGTQNSNPLWHYVLPDQYLRRNPHFGAEQTLVQVVTPPNSPVYPASEGEIRYRRPEDSGRFTSACSGMIYRDSQLFPADEIHAFACEPFHNLVQHFRVQHSGVSFSAARVPGAGNQDFFASADPWSRPVMVREGPDGSLWIADMYRAMIEHPQFLSSEGKQEISRYQTADARGRLYRVARAEMGAHTFKRLDNLSAAELVGELSSPYAWRRDKAHQMLLWRRDSISSASLLALAANQAAPSLARLHALCVLDGLDQLTGAAVVLALGDVDPGVRENALRLAETRFTREVLETAVRLVDDRDPKVRLQAALSLGASSDEAAGAALGRLLVRDAAEPMIVSAVLSSALPHLNALASVVSNAQSLVRRTLTDLLVPIALGTGDRAALARLTAPIFSRTAADYSDDQLSATAQMLDQFAQRNLSVETLRQAAPDDALARLLDNMDGIFESAHRVAVNSSFSIDKRMAAVALVARDPAQSAKAMQLLAEWLEPGHPIDVRQAAIYTLAETGRPEVPAVLAGAWSKLDPSSKNAALAIWLNREAWAFDLLQRVALGEISHSAIDATNRARLVRHEAARVRKLANNLFVSSVSERRSTVVAGYRKALDLPGDYQRGRDVYRRACASCHKHGEEGQEVGPDLASVAAHSREKLLISILDPNADIQPGFNAYTATLETGEQLYGFLATETAQSVTFKQIDGLQRTVRRNQITSLQSQNGSLMPEGLEAGIGQQEMADILAFLRAEQP